MGLASDIKTQIKANLDALVTATTLGEVQEDDFKVGIFDRDFAHFPAAILTTPAIEGESLTNRDNLRTHNFEIVVIEKGENISSATQIEALIEAILDKFDNSPTLNGVANGGVEPSSSTPQAVVSRGKTFIAFSIIIKAKAIKNLTF